MRRSPKCILVSLRMAVIRLLLPTICWGKRIPPTPQARSSSPGFPCPLSLAAWSMECWPSRSVSQARSVIRPQKAPIPPRAGRSNSTARRHLRRSILQQMLPVCRGDAMAPPVAAVDPWAPNKPYRFDDISGKHVTQTANGRSILGHEGHSDGQQIDMRYADGRGGFGDALGGQGNGAQIKKLIDDAAAEVAG